MKKLFLFLLIITISRYSIAAEDYYHFTSRKYQQRFESLTTQLRCLVCQNQTIAESNAPLANDLRNQIYQKINAGQSDNDITHYLVSRYGDFILYQPPLNKATFGLWFGPLMLLIFGISYLLYCIRKKPKISH